MTILGVGAFYTLGMAGNRARGGVTSLWATSSGVPTGFGGKLDDSRPVTSWKSQEVTLRGSCETGPW